MTMSSETSTIYDVAKSKLTADAQLEYAKITLCRFAGIGVLAVMIGAGVGMACFGYSFVTDGRAQAQKMADAMVQALEQAHFTTTGQVHMADGGVVQVDPSSTVRIAGVVNAGASRPPATAPTPVEPIPSPQNRVITQYSTFKTVAYGKGHVVTGWTYDNSNQVNPTKQYCYYDEMVDGKTHMRTSRTRHLLNCLHRRYLRIGLTKLLRLGKLSPRIKFNAVPAEFAQTVTTLNAIAWPQGGVRRKQ